jgi:hypothetical protein
MKFNTWLKIREFWQGMHNAPDAPRPNAARVESKSNANNAKKTDPPRVHISGSDTWGKRTKRTGSLNNFILHPEEKRYEVGWGDPPPVNHCTGEDSTDINEAGCSSVFAAISIRSCS